LKNHQLPDLSKCILSGQTLAKFLVEGFRLNFESLKCAPQTLDLDTGTGTLPLWINFD